MRPLLRSNGEPLKCPVVSTRPTRWATRSCRSAPRYGRRGTAEPTTQPPCTCHAKPSPARHPLCRRSTPREGAGTGATMTVRSGWHRDERWRPGLDLLRLDRWPGVSRMCSATVDLRLTQLEAALGAPAVTLDVG